MRRKDMSMNKSTLVFLINDDVRAIRGEYEPSGTPEVFKTFDPTIRKDDLIVVESGTRHNMTVVKVVDVDVDVDLDSTHQMKWAVARIDEAAHRDTLEQEQAAILAVQSAEKKRKRAELRKSLIDGFEHEIETLKLTKLTEE